MTIRKELDGSWSVFYSKRHPTTKVPYSLRRKSIKTKAEAVRVERSLIVLLEKKFYESIVPTWEKLTNSYLVSYGNQGNTPKTVDNVEKCLKAHTFPDWSKRFVDEITTQEIRDLILVQLSEHSRSHQKNMLKFIRAVFSYAVDTGLIAKNPVPKLKFRIGDKIQGVLTEEQVRVFLNKAKILDSEWYPHWALALYSGLRNGELFSLLWEHVNLDERLIFVKRSWNNKDGFKGTKNHHDRVVEIAPNLLPILSELKIQQHDPEFVLPRILQWSRGEQARELRLFLSVCGLPRIRFHDLRACWATLLLSKGIAPIKVMKMGGWAEMKTMMIYMRKAGVDIRGATNCLNLHNPIREQGKVYDLGMNEDKFI